MMKTIFLICIGLLSCYLGYSQTTDVNKEKTRTAADLKSGNSQDVLSSFFQLGFNDIISDHHSFSFQSSLLAIKAKTDPSIWIDTNYRHIGNFTRNFGFGFDAKLDSGYKFAGSSFNFKYAFINERDKSVFAFSLPNQSEWNKIAKRALNEYHLIEPDTVAYHKAVHYLFPSHGKATPYSELPKGFTDILNKRLAESASFKGYAADSFESYVFKAYDLMAKQIGCRPLATIEAKFATDATGKLFQSTNINIEYLQGLYNIKGDNSIRGISNLELDLKLEFDDSAATAKMLHRQLVSGSAGLNWIMIRDHNRKSLVELKASATETYIVAGLLLNKNEDQNKFTLDGTLRFRITDNLWIPLDFKYDPKAANVFGFLSIKSNFDALGK